MKKSSTILKISMLTTIIVLFCPIIALAAEEEVYKPDMYASFWALIPPIVAIMLALITKEVYSSLFVGILVGSLFYSGFQFEGTILHIFNDGFIKVLCDEYNMGILIFLVILGTMVSLMNHSGGSSAFGRWAKKRIKTRKGAQLSTVLLGILIFVDDYFNCLTVGSVMRPVTDKHNISRAKLAYLIDATAAPICIIAPISSWAAAVSGFVKGQDGLAVFVKAIPYNFYALFTIIFMISIVVLDLDFGKMKVHEANAAKGDIFTNKSHSYETIDEEESKKGTVIDLLIPILSLVICCIIGMIYTGGFFSGTDFITAFSESDASVGLAIGSFFGFLITVILYVCRKVLSFQKCMECIPYGFKAMVPAILILTFAWTLKSMTDSLGAKEYVAALVKSSTGNMVSILPAIIFLVACFLAFATGTSWGTFGILIPIVVEAFSNAGGNIMIISISACMAGAVCGDHCSPISDTTIMASAGAQCDHVNHVSTQLPYAVTVAVISFFTYIVAGLSRSAVVSFGFGIIVIAFTLFILKRRCMALEEK